MKTVCKYCARRYPCNCPDDYEVDLSEFFSYWGLRPSQARSALEQNPGEDLGTILDRLNGHEPMPMVISVTADFMTGAAVTEETYKDGFSIKTE